VYDAWLLMITYPLARFCRWWKEVYGDVKLSYARDRLVENYFWTCGVFHEEEYSRARMLFAKTFGMLSLMDDTYDVYATLEECHVLNEAIQRLLFGNYQENTTISKQNSSGLINYSVVIYRVPLICRWDESAVSTLPEYMKKFYINLLKTFQECEDSLQPDEKYRVSYAKKAVRHEAVTSMHALSSKSG